MHFYDNFANQNLVISHRGYRAIRPENTLSAFEAAIGKCDFIELDIQVTKDYELVVFHDYKLERITDINNNTIFPFNGSYNIYDYTLEELQLLDIGSWFLKDDPFGEIKNNLLVQNELESLEKQRLMTLKDILTFAQTNKIALNIELKDCAYIEDGIFVSKLLDTITTLNINIPLLISSFNHNYLKIIKELDKTISTAINIEEKHPNNLISYLKALDVESYHCCSKIITKDIVEKISQAGFFVNVFTVNDQKEKDRLYNMGVRGIFTDILR